jgi:hypothetical protein
VHKYVCRKWNGGSGYIRKRSSEIALLGLCQQLELRPTRILKRESESHPCQRNMSTNTKIACFTHATIRLRGANGLYCNTHPYKRQDTELELTESRIVYVRITTSYRLLLGNKSRVSANSEGTVYFFQATDLERRSPNSVKATEPSKQKLISSTSAFLDMATQISKKRKFVADGVFRAELNEFFTRELAEEGYSGCDVRVTHARTEVGFLFHSNKRSE